MINTDADQISFADSDQFDDDSVNSWLSDTEDQINNWRGWKKVITTNSQQINSFPYDIKYYQPEKLLNQAAKVVAAIQPGFDLTEKIVPFPEELIKLIAFYSFPASEEEIRLYSCLGCGNVDEFIRGENLYKTKAVQDCLQIGFHLSAKVSRRPVNSQPQGSAGNVQGGSQQPQQQTHQSQQPSIHQYDSSFSGFAPFINTNSEFNGPSSGSGSNPGVKSINNLTGQSVYNSGTNTNNNNNIVKVGVTFDRGRITSCNCSCDNIECVDKAWCSHVVAACLYRIHEAKHVQIRAPISESLSKLSKEDLQKFAQFLISKMNLADILPAAQNILDELLASTNNPMKSIRGAPDLTAGASFEDQSMWFFDHSYIQGNISKILQKFCVPKPVVYGDPRHLSNNLPILAQEYQNILRPMRGKEPEGIWNLISIIRDMFRREDSNALCLLRILTNCLLESELIMMWWYCVKLNQDSCIKSNSQSSNSLHSPYASAYFCDEMVQLWKIAALRYCLPSCLFMTARRLQSHRSELLNDTVTDLMNEINTFHKSVIRTSIICLDKPPTRAVFNNSGNGHVNNVGSNHRHSSANVASVNNSHSVTKDLSITDEEVQRQFIGFKPALEACRICIVLQNQSKSSTEPSSKSNAHTEDQTINETDKHEPINDIDLKINSTIDSSSSTSSIDDGDIESDGGAHKSKNVINEVSSEVINDFDVVGASVLDNLKKTFDDTDLKYSKCEALFYHGYPNEAAQLAYQLAEEMLEQKVEICEKLYRQARIALIQKVSEYQKQNEYKQSSHNIANNPTQSNQLQQPQNQQQSHHFKSFFSSGNKNIRRYRGYNNSSNTTVLSSNIITGSKSSEYHIETDEAYEARTLMKRMQFLITCLVNESIDWSKISPTQRQLMPSKARLIEVAFHLLIFALQLPRPPAPYRHLEVHMIQLEIDMIIQAQQIKWRDYVPNFRSLLTDIALQLKNRTLHYSTEIHAPYNLALFIFEQLTGINGSNSTEISGSGGNNGKTRQRLYSRDRTKCRISQIENSDALSYVDENSSDSSYDINLGFESALSVLGMKSKVPEKINSLLVEGQRRLRDEFAAFLFNVYKDDVEKLTMILNQLLDPLLNPNFKAAPLKFYLSNPLSKLIESLDTLDPPGVAMSSEYSTNFIGNSKNTNNDEIFETNPNTNHSNINTVITSNPSQQDTENTENSYTKNTPNSTAGFVNPVMFPGPSIVQKPEKTVKMHLPTNKLVKYRNEKPAHNIDTDSSALEDDNSETSVTDKKAWEQKFRCFTTSKRIFNQHSTGMAAVDSSAPETTESSDNSPTTIRKRIFPNNQQTALYKIITDGIPCGGENIEKPVSEVENCVTAEEDLSSKITIDLPTDTVPEVVAENSHSSRSTSLSGSSSPQISSSSPVLCDINLLNNSVKESHNLNKESPESIVKNDNDSFVDQKVDYVEIVTESLAHHMFELAQTVLQKAGIPDDSSTPVFRVNNNTNSSVNHGSNSHSGATSASNHLAQRNLQLCAFQLGLYALGLYNHLNPLWQSRTYSSHVAWISTQIVDFGVSAACVLLHSWRHHLNPSEVAEIAYRVSRRRDTQMSRVGAELCLAVLSESSTLNPSQILRGLRQCSDQSSEMLERGLLSVESGANNSLSGVQPIIYFHLAQAWYQLYLQEAGQNPCHTTSTTISSSSLLITQSNSTATSQSSSTIGNHPSSTSYQSTFNTTNIGQYPANMMPQIPQFMNPHNIPSILMSQTAAQLPGGAPFPTSSYGPSLPHAGNGNHSWIYGNIIAGQNTISPSQMLSSNMLCQSPYISHFQMMPMRGLSTNIAPVNVTNFQHRQIYFYQPTNISQHQLQPPHPGSNILPSTLNVYQPNTTRAQNSGSSNNASANQSPSSSSQTHSQQNPVSQSQSTDNRASDCLLRAFNSAMKAIHILKQLQSSSNDNNDSTNNSSNSTISTNSRRPLLFNSSTSEINDYPISSTTESQSHDTNIRWTIKVAKLLGAEEVNRYCVLISQFIQNPFLMKDIIMEVMEFYNLTQMNISMPSDFASSVPNCSSGPTNLMPNTMSSNHHGSGFVPGSRQQGMLLPMPTNYTLMRASSGLPFPSLSGIGLHHPQNTFNAHNITQPLQSSHSHNSFNLSIQISPTQTGIEMVHKMINRLHSLFRKLIDKRLQQTSQGPRDWDSLVELILDACRAQRSLPATDPNLTWLEILQKIKMNRKCTSELWARIYAGLQTLDSI